MGVLSMFGPRISQAMSSGVRCKLRAVTVALTSARSGATHKRTREDKTPAQPPPHLEGYTSIRMIAVVPAHLCIDPAAARGNSHAPMSRPGPPRGDLN